MYNLLLKLIMMFQQLFYSTLNPKNKRKYDDKKAYQLEKSIHDILIKKYTREKQYNTEKILAQTLLKSINLSPLSHIEHVQKITDKFNHFNKSYRVEVEDFNDQIAVLRKKQRKFVSKNQDRIDLVTKYKKIFNLQRHGDFEYLNHVTETLDRKRESMPQIPLEELDTLLNHFEKVGIKVIDTLKPIKDIKHSQNQIDPETVVKKYKNNNFKPYYIISKDGLFSRWGIIPMQAEFEAHGSGA